MDQTDDTSSERDYLETNQEDIDNFSICDDEYMEDNNVAIYIETIRGKPSLLLNGHKYRQVYKSKKGIRWNCSRDKNCSAFLYINNDDEIIKSHLSHDHPESERLIEAIDPHSIGSKAVVINSRKGKELLLYRQFTYRKQYSRGDKIRWVCSTTKNCHGCVFTNMENKIMSSCEDHHHEPPKYYLKPDHVLDALREPIILETD